MYLYFLAWSLLLAGTFYLGLGIYGLSLGARARVNRLFFWWCLALTVWAVAVFAQCFTQERAFFGSWIKSALLAGVCVMRFACTWFYASRVMNGFCVAR